MPDSKQVSLFDFQGHRVRTVMIDGNPWFVGADVCRVLGFENTSTTLYKLDCGEKQIVTLHRMKGIERPERGNPNVNAVNESGLYKLVMRSDKPQAKPFQDWVTKVVLPSIRKDGGYVLDEEKVVTGELSEDEFILKAVQMLQKKADRLVLERDQERARADKAELELNVVTMDEWRALNHIYMTQSNRGRLASFARSLAAEAKLVLPKQERAIVRNGRTILTSVNIYPAHILDKAAAALGIETRRAA